MAIGGFSQGGHVSLTSLFRLKQPLAACIALSTWLEPGLDWEVTRCFFPKKQRQPCLSAHVQSSPPPMHPGLHSACPLLSDPLACLQGHFDILCRSVSLRSSRCACSWGTAQQTL